MMMMMMMMMKILLLLLLVLLGGAVIDGGNNGTNHSSSPGVEELLFDRFSAASNMTLNDGAVVDVNGTLRLTTPAGHAFYSTPFNNNFSFSSTFVIAITKSGAFAFAFTGNLSSKWFRVEFDTDEHNHIRVGINLNGVKNKCNASLQLELELGGDDEELLIQAWVDYDSSINQLEVRLSPNSSSKSNLPLLSWNNDDDLSPILVDETIMYVGFSALRGVSYIRGGSFRLNGKGKGKGKAAAIPSPPPVLPEQDQDAVQVQLSGGVTDPCLFLVIGFCGTLIIGTADWAYKTYAAG
ncbi:L-type lectin-domain containing receptor kinase S.4-like [Lotus japonicus]|nr:L-type lectin-domain containing receptor kinase S.4-like [Lotus japonicus]